ncbi:cobyric acid synthase [Lacrimispora algidixylanolytica]|uniref:Cobyric acid synthase n=1 Tax=Lacrimispora algidixylanolytica TaxID=94868 RepID=A0A419STV7_9FIRM|nr:cobyric acid synthase [Lacrimispora algidixylanolytica]RKD28691.1 cobyric acid synthase CobQ [Lacrimispora algidixylanolytica]
MAKTIMIQGTMSNAGKSLIVAGLCRIFKQDGFRVAPFKSQNMALNSFITEEGLEMGRAQVVQAEAAGVKPEVAMNPILLKPTNDVGSQVIVNGISIGNMPAREYFAYKKELVPEIQKAFDKLSNEYDIIVIEGAGSPAEINLKKDDIVNMGMAKMANAPVLLVGDIDRGGVFAQLYGTVMLLEQEERDRIVGLIVNKFRGDKTILDPGLAMIEEKLKIPVAGVVPYMNVDIEDEDSLGSHLEGTERTEHTKAEIAVIRFPRISNFTDFQVFSIMPEIQLRYVDKAQDLGRPDLVILPGSKNTIEDLLWMRQNGLEAAILKLEAEGVPIFGICGGFQMLGETLSDPHGMETDLAPLKVRGMGLLPVRTVFGKEKTRTRVAGAFASVDGVLAGLSGRDVEGYEIHMGETVRAVPPLSFVLESQSGSHLAKMDGCQKRNTYGTYIHGIFDKEGIAEAVAEGLMKKKGISGGVEAISYQEYKEEQYERLAGILRESLDMEEIYRIMGITQHK